MNDNPYYTHLFWANEKQVESEHLSSRTRSDASTMCWMILEGSVRITNARETIHAGPGEWLFLESSVVEQHFLPGTCIRSIRFDFRQRGGAPVFLRKRNQVFSEKKFPELERCARDLIDSYYPWRNYQSIRFAGRAVSMESIFILESVFNRWLVSYIETMKALGATLAPVEFMDVRVSQAIYLIQQFPLRNKFGEKELAQRIGLSVNQLCRLFKKHLGVTPYGYYEKHRLQVARDVIETTSMPMKEIAYELGFASTSNFSNWYRERVGQSPRAARKSGSVVV